MSPLSREAMMELMAYADGELDGDALARAEQLVKSSDEARRLVDAMRGIGEVVRELPEAHASERASGIADDVMARIAEDAPSAKVIRVRFRMMAAVAVAIAAGVALYVRTNAPPSAQVASDQPHETQPVIQPAPGASESAPSPVAAVAQASDTKEVDLEEVDSPDHNVSVFYVPKSVQGAAASAQVGASSLVVWIDDHGGH